MVTSADLQRAAAETDTEHASRVLRFALHCYDLTIIDAHLLRVVDAAAMRQIAALPASLSPTDAIQIAALSETRHRVAAAQTAKRAAWARIVAEMAEPTATQGAAAPAPDPAGEMTEAEQAARLLKAALLLIMGGSDDDPGKPRVRPMTPAPRPQPPQGGAQNPVERATIPAPRALADIF